MIESAEGTYEKGMSAGEFLKISAPFLKMIGIKGVPLRTMGEIMPDWYSKMGIKTGKSAHQSFALLPGQVIAAVGCSLAAWNMPLIDGEQAVDGCALKAKIGSSMFTFGGEFTVTITRRGQHTDVEAASIIPGQLFDWGASKGYIANLFGDINRYANLQPSP